MLSREDFENMKLDMVRELRDMKDSLIKASLANTEVIRELKDMNLSIVR